MIGAAAAGGVFFPASCLPPTVYLLTPICVLTAVVRRVADSLCSDFIQARAAFPHARKEAEMAEKQPATFRTITRDVPPSVFDKSLIPEKNRVSLSIVTCVFERSSRSYLPDGTLGDERQQKIEDEDDDEDETS